MRLTGWGQYPSHKCNLVAPRSIADAQALIAAGHCIPRGNGRAYGDSALNTAMTMHMKHFNRMVSFDDHSGQLVAESGILLADVIAAFLPKGWFPSVTPGTKFVTLGGMVAADVHGKNHHKDGSLGQFIDWIEVLDCEGRVRRCSREQNEVLFAWTIGGMGLTGIILRVAMRLQRIETSWIRQTSRPARNVDVAIDQMEGNLDATYSVAWIDCLAKGSALGRSVVMFGEHATVDELAKKHRKTPLKTQPKRRLNVPMNAPAGLLNQWTLRAFNHSYYNAGIRNKGTRLVDWDSYFYPLDAILNWNRIYGRKGFAQFQCVLPLETSRNGIRALLQATSNAGTGSFLAVLKRFGKQNGPFSFPMPGYTLALDFPINRKTLMLMQQMDDIMIAHQGRSYLAKDSRMTAATLRQTDPRVDMFTQMRETLGARDRFSSVQSERLKL